MSAISEKYTLDSQYYTVLASFPGSSPAFCCILYWLSGSLGMRLHSVRRPSVHAIAAVGTVYLQGSYTLKAKTKIEL